MSLRSHFIAILAVLLSFVAGAATDTVLILHTNDLHDHIRAGYNGAGGLSYVSGYIKSVQQERRDTLVLDAGDVTEKGDMVSFLTQSAVMYEAMGKAGYDACTIGNHDLNSGLPLMLSRVKIANPMEILCLNYVEQGKGHYFTPSKVFDVDGVKVAVIGLTLPKGGEIMDMAETKAALKVETGRLVPQSDVQVVVAHMDSRECRELAEVVPDIDVFVSGHSHEVLAEPILAPASGALVVQAGEYAQYVGRVELTVDLDTKKVTTAKGELVPMQHDKIPCDKEMTAWVATREQEVCPEASHVVARLEKPMGRMDVARLAAAAFRKAGDADIGFCHPGQVIRDELPAGEIDVNALFCTGGQRGYKVVSTTLSGAQIEAYLSGVMKSGKGQTEWNGFRGKVKYYHDGDSWRAATNLDPGKTYRVVMPEVEWNTRFMKTAVQPEAAGGDASKPSVTACDFSFASALAAYSDDLAKQGASLVSQAATLKKEVALDEKKLP